MTPYRVVRHPDVVEDVDDILSMLTEHVGRTVALSKVRRLLRDIDELAYTPHIGTLRNEIALGLRAIPVGGNAVVAFAVHEDTRDVMVYAVTWGGADWMGKVRGRTP